MNQRAGRLRVAVVGLRFGGSFPPIYLEHPDVAEVTICDINAQTLKAYGDQSVPTNPQRGGAAVEIPSFDA